MTAVVMLVDHRLPTAMCYQEAVDRASALPPREAQPEPLSILSGIRQDQDAAGREISS